MSGINFNISPSINLNLETPEKTEIGNIVDLKLGFGPRVSSNSYDKKERSSIFQVFFTSIRMASFLLKDLISI